MADNKTEPLRQQLEKLGYTVTWQGGNQPIVVSKGNQTSSISPGEYSIVNGRAYVSPETLQKATGYTPLRSTLEGKFDIGWNANTGEATVTHPISGQSYTFKPQTVWGGKTYVDPTYLETIKSRVTPSYEKMYGDVTTAFNDYTTKQQDLYNQMYQQQQQLLSNYMNQINNYMQKYSDYGLAMLQAYESNYSKSLAELQKLTQQQAEVPESTKMAINMIKEQTDKNVQALNEEMNRRGIYTSGLAAKMEEELRKGGTTDQQKLLAQWLDQQHKQMYEASLQLAQAYQNYASGYANVMQKAYQEPLAQLVDQAGRNYQLMSALIQDRLNRQSSLAQQTFDTLTKLRQWYAEQESQALANRQRNEAEQLKAQLQAQYQLTKALYPWTMGMTPYQEASLTELQRWHDIQQALEQQQLAIESSKANNSSSSDLMYSVGDALLRAVLNGE